MVVVVVAVVSDDDDDDDDERWWKEGSSRRLYNISKDGLLALTAPELHVYMHVRCYTK